MSKMELNVENYTIEDLFKIIRMNDENPSLNLVEAQVGQLKTRFENNPEMKQFFDDVFKKLKENMRKPNDPEIAREYSDEYDSDDGQYGDWASNQHLESENKSVRRQKINIYDHEHSTMKRERLDVKQEFAVPIAQGDLNPRLTNTITRVTSIDSKYRKNAITDVSFSTIGSHHLSPYSSTDFIIELTEPLKNVLSIQLYSVHVPYTWYNVDLASNTNSFQFTPSTGATQTITLPSGNYSAADLAEDLSANSDISGATYDSKTGKISITFTSSGEVIFYDQTNDFCNNNHFINNNFGWTMGFRDSTYVTDVSGQITSDAPFVRHHMKHLLLSIEDFNSNHPSNGLIGIKNIDKPLSLPNYKISDVSGTHMINPNNCNIDVSNNIYSNYPVFTQGFPRQITQAQQYSLNEIIKSRKQLTTTKAQGPNIPNLFAIVPIKTSGLSIGDPVIEFSGGIQSNSRTYFGPVDIERIHVRLLDDMGNVLNLNGNDWSFVIKSEHLYQY